MTSGVSRPPIPDCWADHIHQANSGAMNRVPTDECVSAWAGRGDSLLCGSYRYYVDLLSVLVAKDLKVRYRSTVLGYAWSLLHPLAFALIFYFLFRVWARLEIRNYALFLITGLFPWHWVQNSATASTHWFLGNGSLIKKVRFPSVLLVVAGVLNDLIHFVLTIPVIAIFLLWHQELPALSWLYEVPVMVVVTFLVTFGLALFFATCNLFLRDIERLVSLLFTLWFYVTPVLFPADMLPERLWWLSYANPLAALIIAWRGVFLEGGLPLDLASIALIWGGVFVLLGYRVYGSCHWRFAELV